MTDEKIKQPSKAKFAQPQPPKPRVAPMPDRCEDDMCPACFAGDVLRRTAREFRVGELRIQQCRVGHRWSKDGKAAVERLAQSEARMRKARAQRAKHATTVDEA